MDAKFTLKFRYGLLNVLLTNCWANDNTNESGLIVPHFYTFVCSIIK